MTTHVRISLPFPPSAWDMYVGWGRTRRLSAEYAKWRQDVAFFLKRSTDPIAVPFYIGVCLKRPNKRQDLDNRIKPILDVLQLYGVIRNDNLCERITMQWDHGMKEECVVMVIPAEESLAA